MSISQTENTKITLSEPTDELTFVVGPYSKKIRQSVEFDLDQDRTQQEFADECDINNIMARYQKTGLIEFVNQHEPQYGDVTGYEFNAMQDQIVMAKNMFADLPSHVRDRFANDPARFLDFINDENNAQEAAKMGLLAPEKAEAILNPQPDKKTAPEPSKSPEPTGEK